MSNLSNKQFLTRILLSGKRLDGRDLLQNRDISVIFSTKLGGIELSYGETRIFTSTKASIVSPHVSRPSEGFIKFKVDMQVIGEDAQGGNTLYEGINATNPKKYSMELEKIIERIIKGSKALDPESLCIQSAKSVWSIQVDSIVINNSGNLIDALFLKKGVILSLLHFRRPQVEVLPKEGVRVFKESEKRFMPLSIHHIPITFTFALIEEGDNNSIAIDPTLEEEIVSGGRITVAVNIYGDISYILKPGGLPISQKLICQIIQVCIAKVPQYTTLLRDFLSKSNQITFNKIKSQIQQPQQLLFSLGSTIDQQTQTIEVETYLKARMDQE